MNYATLGQLRAYIEPSNLDMATEDDAKLFQYLTWASRRVERFCKGRRFCPRTETRSYDYQGDSREHILDDDLLSLTTLTVDDTEISSSNYFLYPLSSYPKWKIEMDRGGGEIFTFSDTPQSAVDVLGVWGWHDRWGDAWADSSDTVQDSESVAADATTLTVSDPDGDDVDGWSPRLSAGHLLKIESEYLAVTATDKDTKKLTVKRGVNGTTAAAHDNGKTIYVYRPPEVVVGATLDLAKWVYEHRSQVGGMLALPGALEGAVIKVAVQEILGAWELPVRLGFLK